MYRIDTSKYTPDQLAQYRQLIEIGKADVDPEAAEEEMEEEMPPFPPKKKPTKKAEVEDMEKSVDPTVAAAMQRLETLEKSFEMNGFMEIAKKYAPLGENEEDLAKTLYDMKKSNEANYNAYIGILDKSLALVEKSGLFAEVGKSASGPAAGSVEAKADAKAKEIMKADPLIGYTEAIAKAWEDPALFAEYDAEYQR